MSQKNVEIVRAMYEAFLRGSFEESLAAFHPEVEWDVSIRPEGRVYRGHAGVVDAIRTWNGTWEDFTAEIEAILDAGKHVVLIDHQTGRGKGSMAPLDQQTFWVYTLRDMRIVRVKWFATRRQEALEAAGLRE
jgi:ketosteroid isomerase-like protein